MTTTSGRCWRTKARADSPFSASPTRTKVGSLLRTKVTSTRMSALSSTTKIRRAKVLSSSICHATIRFHEWQRVRYSAADRSEGMTR